MCFILQSVAGQGILIQRDGSFGEGEDTFYGHLWHWLEADNFERSHLEFAYHHKY